MQPDHWNYYHEFDGGVMYPYTMKDKILKKVLQVHDSIVFEICDSSPDPSPQGIKEARKKFEAQMMLVDESRKIKTYSPDDLIGVELMIRDDELYRKESDDARER